MFLALTILESIVVITVVGLLLIGVITILTTATVSRLGTQSL